VLRCVVPPEWCRDTFARWVVHKVIAYLFQNKTHLRRNAFIDRVPDVLCDLEPLSYAIDPPLVALSYYMESPMPEYDVLGMMFGAFPGLRKQLSPDLMIRAMCARFVFGKAIHTRFTWKTWEKHVRVWMSADATRGDVLRIMEPLCDRNVLLEDERLAFHLTSGECSGVRSRSAKFGSDDGQGYGIHLRMLRTKLLEIVPS
jgi:hypothetical protein